MIIDGPWRYASDHSNQIRPFDDMYISRMSIRLSRHISRWMDRSEQWEAVAQLYLNLAYREAQDLIDPPGGWRAWRKKPFSPVSGNRAIERAAMATRLNPDETGRLWAQQARWRAAHPDDWWLGIPVVWLNEQPGPALQIGGIP